MITETSLQGQLPSGLKEKLKLLVKLAWGTPVRRVVTAIVGIIVGVIGLLASVAQLWPLVFPATPDVAIELLSDNTDTIIFNTQAKRMPLLPIVAAGTIIIDGTILEAPPGAVFLANRLIFKNAGSIQGTKFSVIATSIEGGRLDASGSAGTPGDAKFNNEPGSGSSGGSIFVAAAAMEGTVMRAVGGAGGEGARDDPGSAERPAADGRNGRCDGFGRWRAAQGGADGKLGNPGSPGQNGGRGGNGGAILALLSNLDPSPDALASKGSGGEGGTGGKGGPGQQGGKGGSGCTGLGGAQDGRPNARNGLPGSEGADGKPGPDGNEGSTRIRQVRFYDIAATWQRLSSQPVRALEAVRQIQPHN